MKNVFRIILALAVMFGTYTSYAIVQFEVSANTTNIIAKGNVISVSDAAGRTIYSGRTNNNGTIKSLYDFSQLNDGTYFIEIDKDFEIETKAFEVKNHVVTFLESTDKTYFKPVIKIQKGKVLVSKLAFQEEDVKIELYYKGDLIHSETIVSNSILIKAYKMDKNLKGDYTAIIRVNGRAYIESFKL